MSRPEDADAVRYDSRYASAASAMTIGACPMCAAPLPTRRARYCSGACKQLAFRLRRQRSAAPNVALVRQQLKRQRLLAAHTIYECPSCGERSLGEQRCSTCQLFCRALGLGGSCPDCDTLILLAELIGQEGGAPS